ncbi:hypothetical protein [Prevotella sp. HUN102]|nr:hypothetical protein [Prevotella sp. HUN102]
MRQKLTLITLGVKEFPRINKLLPLLETGFPYIVSHKFASL